ncbi:MAG: hypothetical protein K2G27_02905 [Duncaniella sp.]|nr:hypothetical protein [Duncaniella sp.]
MWPANNIKRLWRGRGHGVHSPFAYRFITNVLRLKGSYYATSELEHMPDPRWHTLLFRLVCEFEPERMVMHDASPTERRAVALADSRVKIEKGSARGIAVMRSAKGEVTAFRDVRAASGDWSGKVAGMPSGMTFTDGVMGVTVERPDLPRQDFEIDFRL